MEYLAKYRLSKNKYMAVLDKAIVIVTTDDNGKEIRWAIFDKANDTEVEDVKQIINRFRVQQEQ